MQAVNLITYDCRNKLFERIREFTESVIKRIFLFLEIRFSADLIDPEHTNKFDELHRPLIALR